MNYSVGGCFKPKFTPRLRTTNDTCTTNRKKTETKMLVLCWDVWGLFYKYFVVATPKWNEKH